MSPQLRLTSVTITAPEPRRLATFYAALLGGDVVADEPASEGQPPEAGWCQVRVGPQEAPFTLNVEWERCWQAPVWPAEPGRGFATQHLDIQVDDLDEAQAHAEELGARLADAQFLTGVRVMIDPAGHPFCLFT